MADDLLKALTQFHRDVVLPDIERIVDTRLGALRDEMNSHFNAIYKRFDRILGLATPVILSRKDGEGSHVAGYEVTRLEAKHLVTPQPRNHFEILRCAQDDGNYRP